MPVTPTTAMVLAAGLGVRMRPLTDRMPKPLVPVAGKPLLDHVLDKLADAGVDTAVVNVHYLPDQIIDHVAGRKHPHVVISDERDVILGTGGAVVKALPRLGTKPFFHLNADLDAGFLITEDFGTASFVDGTPPAPMPERYHAAADLLAKLHHDTLPETLPLAPQLDYAIPAFDTDAMLIEIGLMLEWYLPDRDVQLGAPLRAAFVAMWRELLARPVLARRTWMLRDYHSPNLIWLDDHEDIARVGVIDFQDTVLGPPAYDLVSLAQDARIDVPDTLEIALLSRYAKARREADPAFDAAAFVESYAIMSAQRNTRLLGTFARLNRRDGKPQYLKHQPRIWTYLNRSLAHPALADLGAWYEAHVPPPQG